MDNCKIVFFRTDREANDALASYLFSNECVSVTRYTFSSNDVKNHEVIYEGMPEREWDGWMFGIKVTTDFGESIVFASWDDDEQEIVLKPDSRKSECHDEEAHVLVMRALASFN